MTSKNLSYLFIALTACGLALQMAFVSPTVAVIGLLLGSVWSAAVAKDWDFVSACGFLIMVLAIGGSLFQTSSPIPALILITLCLAGFHFAREQSDYRPLQIIQLRLFLVIGLTALALTVLLTLLPEQIPFLLILVLAVLAMTGVWRVVGAIGRLLKENKLGDFPD